VSNLLAGADFLALFTAARRSVRRLETRDHYEVPEERELLTQFLTGQYGEAAHRAYFADWVEPVTAATTAGIRFERVRVVPEPLTPYLRLEVRWNRYNAEAGEDIRYLPRCRANELDLPAQDFWVFDGERVALMYFTADDRLLGVEVLTDPDLVASHEAWIDRAWTTATPYADYLAANPAREQPPPDGP
jgi:hypothetical protein